MCRAAFVRLRPSQQLVKPCVPELRRLVTQEGQSRYTELPHRYLVAIILTREIGKVIQTCILLKPLRSRPILVIRGFKVA
ncbi:hypothetical protein VTK56DRAFT_622 [Thermocarpiscus australiensis]